jgi:predicted nucleotidyltransferase
MRVYLDNRCYNRPFDEQTLIIKREPAVAKATDDYTKWRGMGYTGSKRTAMPNNIDAVRAELDTLTKIIVKTVPVEQIYLFGSYAYGTPHKDSDLDLYVVLKDDAPMRAVEAMDSIRLAMYNSQNKPIDLLVLKQNRFLDRKDGLTTIERIVAKEGVKIYG